MNTSEYSDRRAAEMQNKIDQDNLAMAIALESRGEGLDGMFAVAKSILNRHELINTKQVLPSTFMPDSINSKPTITDILFYPNQYQVVDSKNKTFKKQDSPVTAKDLEQARKAGADQSKVLDDFEMKKKEIRKKYNDLIKQRIDQLREYREESTIPKELR